MGTHIFTPVVSRWFHFISGGALRYRSQSETNVDEQDILTVQIITESVGLPLEAVPGEAKDGSSSQLWKTMMVGIFFFPFSA
jgi:hypothetical protein